VYGLNESEPLLKDHDGKSLEVVDVFSTIQGEGPFTGRRATFIRLAGCHLKCYFCDTDFRTNRHMLPVDVLVAKARVYGNELVVLTGGEPLRQNVVPLARALVTNGFAVQVETAGSFWPAKLEDLIAKDLSCVSVVVSPKTFSVHAGVHAHAMAWKYIIGLDDWLDADGLPLFSTQEKGKHTKLARPHSSVPRQNIWVQPRDDYDPEKNRDNRMRCIQLVQTHGYRMSLQTHKILELP
jgi:organic radical activating enzyme